MEQLFTGVLYAVLFAIVAVALFHILPIGELKALAARLFSK